MVEVTRSLSNLLKGFTIAVDDTDKRVIDYNDIISEKLNEIRNSLEDKDFSGDGFSAGLNPINVSEVLTGEEQIIGENASEANEAVEKEFFARKEIIIAEAQTEADEIVNRANEDAAAIIAEAQAEAERIRAKAKETGYAEGKAAASEEAEIYLNQAREELAEKEEQLAGEYRKKEEEMEPALVDTILKIFSEITHAVSVDKRDMILTLVNNVMAGGESSRNFIIRVCNEDARFLKENRDKIINAVRKDVHIEIVTDPSMKRNECLIDTDTGVYDCSLDIQMENLINDIRILACTGE